MATVNLLPNADVSLLGPAWTISSGSDVWAMLDDDDTGHVTSDSSDIEATATGKVCEVSFQNHSLAAGTTIDSVQAVVKHNNRGRGATYRIEVKINHSGGTYYTENIYGTGSSSWVTTTQTSRATSDGSTAWTLGEIDGLQMRFSLTAISGGTVGITYAYFIVTYTAAAAVTQNATFFGANF